MSNRRTRRALEKHRRKMASVDPNAAHVKQLAEKIGRLNEEQQRLSQMVQLTDRARALASQITVAEKPEGWTEEDGDPNAFRTLAIEEATEKGDKAREQLVVVLDELYDAFEALGEPAPAVVVAPAAALRALESR
jgi:predicted transcriptional regulator